MTITLRCFRPEGIRLFREYLGKLREGATDAPPFELLTRGDTSTALEPSILLEHIIAPDHFTMARYLASKVTLLPAGARQDDTQLWSWLSLYYFDFVCPKRPDGTRAPGRDYRHIPERGYRYLYRHLLSGPFDVYRLFGERSRFMLTTPVHRESQILHELCARQNLISNPAVIGAAELLYFDAARGFPKPRVVSAKREPGVLYRFVAVIQQLDLTYDLHSMSADHIVGLLPKEFDEWRPPLRLSVQ